MMSLRVCIVFSLIAATMAEDCPNNAGACYHNGRCPIGYICDGLDSGTCCPTFTITTTRPPPACAESDMSGPCVANKCPSGFVCRGGDCCATCTDSDPECPYWASNGFCTNPFYAGSIGTCKKTCKLC